MLDQSPPWLYPVIPSTRFPTTVYLAFSSHGLSRDYASRISFARGNACAADARGDFATWLHKMCSQSAKCGPRRNPRFIRLVPVR